MLNRADENPKAEPLSQSDKIAIAVKWIGFLLLLEWAIIHIFAGVVSLATSYQNNIAAYLIGINQAAPPGDIQATAEVTYWSPLAQAVFIQHAWNLLFVGVWAAVLAILNVTRPLNRMAFVFVLYPNLADWAFFLGVDAAGYAPGYSSAQTFIVSAAAMCIQYQVKRVHGDAVSAAENIAAYAAAGALFVAAIILAIYHAATA
jgi:hypothetical protein